MWNQKNITPPPINSYRSTNKTLDLKTLQTVLNNAIQILENQRLFKHEAAILSRCIYRMKTKFRSDKGMKSMEKTNKALHTYLNFNIVKDIEYLLKSLPHYYTSETYLPTKQMSEYLLVRLQGFAQLMARIIQTTCETASLMISRIKLGHFWNFAIIVLAMSSRIWCVSRQILKECCNWYSSVLVTRNILELKGMEWLPIDYEFPINLMTWLNNYWIEEQPRIVVEKQMHIPIFSLLDDSEDEDSDVEFCSQYKNDCIIIDDNYEVDDDIQFVKEFINLTRRRTAPLNEMSIINLDDDTFMDNPITINDSLSETDRTILIDDDENNVTRVCYSPISIHDSTIIPKDSSTVTNLNVSSDTISDVTLTESDIGELISRRELPSISPSSRPYNTRSNQPVPKSKKKYARKLRAKKRILKNIKNIEELRKFAKEENLLRRKNHTNCFTNNLDKLQWNMLYNAVKSNANFKEAKNVFLKFMKTKRSV